MTRAADELSSGDDERRARRDDEIDDLTCHCPKPMPMPVEFWGSKMPGHMECQRCGRPVT